MSPNAVFPSSILFNNHLAKVTISQNLFIKSMAVEVQNPLIAVFKVIHQLMRSLKDFHWKTVIRWFAGYNFKNLYFINTKLQVSPVNDQRLKMQNKTNNFVDTENSSENWSCLQLPSVMKSHRKTMYCYFVVDRPRKQHSGNRLKNVDYGAITDLMYSDSFEWIEKDEDCLKKDSETISTRTKCSREEQANAKVCSRQRSCSEGSDDGFICFVDDNNQTHDTSIDWESDSNCSDTNDSDTMVDHNGYCDSSTESQLDSGFADCKKVRFNLTPQIHVMRTWDFAYRAARKGHWEDHARDRARFHQRIDRAAIYLDPILNFEHRKLVFDSRFSN